MASNLRDIKQRMLSVQSTRQLTNAMQLVAASKVRKARTRAKNNQPYFENMYQAMMQIGSSSRGFDSPFLHENADAPGKLWVVIAGDRGLAGGYNSAVLKLAESKINKEYDKVLALGKKSEDFFTKRGYQVVYSNISADDKLSDVDYTIIERKARHPFLRKEVSSVHLIYTNFVSNLVSEPATLQILPVVIQGETEVRSNIQYDPSPEVVFENVVRMYVGGIIRSGITESYASELAARQNAMQSATDSADEIISNLNLSYNRARQAAITQEITEIVGGANAAG